jgi:hypothetical protein
MREQQIRSITRGSRNLAVLLVLVQVQPRTRSSQGIFTVVASATGLDHPGVVAWIQQQPDSDGLTAAGRITFSSRWMGLSQYQYYLSFMVAHYQIPLFENHLLVHLVLAGCSSIYRCIRLPVIPEMWSLRILAFGRWILESRSHTENCLR